MYSSGFGSVSIFYDLLQASVVISSDKFRCDWEKDLDTTISEDVWDAILDNIHSSSINARHALVQFKVVHRLHYSKSRLHAIYPNSSPLCDKCKQEAGTLAHQFWLCPKLNSYWSLIFDYLSKAFDKNIEPDPILALFGSVTTSSILNSFERQAISLCTLLAKRLILQQWKSETSPVFQQWLRDLGKVLNMERIRYAMKKKDNVFLKIWQPLLDRWSVSCTGTHAGGPSSAWVQFPLYHVHHFTSSSMLSSHYGCFLAGVFLLFLSFLGGWGVGWGVFLFFLFIKYRKWSLSLTLPMTLYVTTSIKVILKRKRNKGVVEKGICLLWVIRVSVAEVVGTICNRHCVTHGTF